MMLGSPRIPSRMPTDRETRRRLRSLELRSEDLVLVRVLLAIALRVIGGLLCVLAVAESIMVSAYVWQPGWGGPSTLDLTAHYGGPAVKIVAGVFAIVMAVPLARRLVPARVPKPHCPACGYQLTTLDDGRCTECEYELTPARDGPMSSVDRLLFTRSLVATVARIAGIAIAYYGVGRFALLGLTKYMFFTPSLAEQYVADRDLLWSVVLIALGIATYALAEWLARVAFLGIARKGGGPAPAGTDPPSDQDPDLS